MKCVPDCPWENPHSLGVFHECIMCILGNALQVKINVSEFPMLSSCDEIHIRRQLQHVDKKLCMTLWRASGKHFITQEKNKKNNNNKNCLAHVNTMRSLSIYLSRANNSVMYNVRRTMGFVPYSSVIRGLSIVIASFTSESGRLWDAPTRGHVTSLLKSECWMNWTVGEKAIGGEIFVPLERSVLERLSKE